MSVHVEVKRLMAQANETVWQNSDLAQPLSMPAIVIYSGPQDDGFPEINPPQTRGGFTVRCPQFLIPIRNRTLHEDHPFDAHRLAMVSWGDLTAVLVCSQTRVQNGRASSEPDRWSVRLVGPLRVP